MTFLWYGLLILGVVYHLVLTLKYGLFWDIEVYLCAAGRMALNLSPYLDLTQGNCSTQLPYVYIPLLSRFLPAGLSLFGREGLYFILAVTAIASVAIISLCGFKWSREPSTSKYFLFFFSMLGGYLFYGFRSGNLALLFYALLGMALVSHKESKPFLAWVCALGSLIKFQYMTFFLIPLCCTKSRRKSLLPLAVLIGCYLLDYFLHPTEYQSWSMQITRIDQGDDWGFGFYYFFKNAVNWFGVGQQLPPIAFGALIYLAMASIFLLIFFQKLAKIPTAHSRLAFSLIASVLLLPRLKIYDLFLIWPALLIIERDCPTIPVMLKKIGLAFTHIFPLLTLALLAIKFVWKFVDPAVSEHMRSLIFNPTPFFICVLFF
jgi:hypothetical protein